MREHPLPQLSVQQLDYLVAVADAPTWAAAASDLGVTPSALSQGLAELERRLGIAVFEKDGRRRVLAARSAPIVDYARRVLSQTGDLSRWIDRSVAGSAGSIRVGMIDAAAIGHYSTVLQAFRAGHPDVAFTLSVAPSSELLVDLAADRLDLVVVVRPPVLPPNLDWIDVLDEPLAVYAPPNADVGIDVSHWGPWVSFSSTSHTRLLIGRALADAGAPFDVVAESNQPEVLREMVRLGMGWTVLPVIQGEVDPAPLTRARAAPLLYRTLVAATRSGAIANPLVVQLINDLQAS